MDADTLHRTAASYSEPAARLSPSDYYSLTVQAKEDSAIWTRAWVGLGFAADVARPGDVLPITVGNHGIHVERQTDGMIVGRFNKAQHGGCRAVPLQCQTGTKTKCSFTACGYSRDRRPIFASDPDRLLHLDQYLGLRPERLLTVATRAWGPLIAARLDPAATAPLDWSDIWSVPDGTTYRDDGGETFWIEHEANWKHLVVALASGEGPFRARVRFPNVVVLSSETIACFIVVHPTAIRKTLCRIRVLVADGEASRLDDVLHVVTARAERAEAWQADPPGAFADAEAEPMRSWFEGEVRRAFATVDGEERGDVFYRTNSRGEW